MNNPFDHLGHEPDLRPYLCIPYWIDAPNMNPPTDDGNQRPLPGTVDFRHCQAIHVKPHFPMAHPTPTPAVDIKVDICNFGGGNFEAIAIVSLFWAEDPNVLPHFLAACAVSVKPRGGIATTPYMFASLPHSITFTWIPGQNFVITSIFARVTHSLDVAGNVVDAQNDRHWAQLDLRTQ